MQSEEINFMEINVKIRLNNKKMREKTTAVQIRLRLHA